MSNTSRSTRAPAPRSCSRKKASTSPSRWSRQASVAAHSRSTHHSGSPSRAADACADPLPALAIEPAEIVFRDFVVNETYEAVLAVSNNTAISRFVRIAPPDSHQFSIHAMRDKSKTSSDHNGSSSAQSVSHGSSEDTANSTSARLAAGLSLRVRVRFTPDSDRHDFRSTLSVMTEDENRGGWSECYATVPLRAHRSRGQLELPEQLTVHDAPVRGSSKTALFLRNISPTVDCRWRAVVVAREEGAASVPHNSKEIAFQANHPTTHGSSCSNHYPPVTGRSATTTPTTNNSIKTNNRNSNNSAAVANVHLTTTSRESPSSSLPSAAAAFQLVPNSGFLLAEAHGGGLVPVQVVFTPVTRRPCTRRR